LLPPAGNVPITRRYFSRRGFSRLIAVSRRRPACPSSPIVIEHYVGEGERSIATRADVPIAQPPSVLRVIGRFVVDEAQIEEVKALPGYAF
jgi:hypothetical protein